LAGDAVAALEFLKGRSDIDSKQIGMLGCSQASGVMSRAAARANDAAFIVSLSNGGLPAADSDLDYQKSEMRLTGYSDSAIAQVVEQTNLLNNFLRTGEGWEKWKAMLPPGASVPDRDDPHWKWMSMMAFSDPVPVLEKLRVPTLAIWGGLDNITNPEKSKPIWENTLKRSGHSDYKLVVLPKGDHDMLEAETGSSAEMPRLQRFVPEYFTTVITWLTAHIRGFDGSN
jgi:pimeloyl-ACP methyl ester carboxylesterase